MPKYIVDHETHDYKKTLRALNRIKNTTATFHGEYHQDREYCQLLVETERFKTDSELENWLYKSKSVGCYVGVVTSIH